MFGAIGRWIRAIGYLITGNLDAARRVIDVNPHVVRAKYDEVIAEKTKRIQQYKQAVAGLIAQQEMKVAKVKTLSEETGKLEKLKAGALAKAQKLVEQLRAAGKSEAEIKAHADYVKCLGAFKDFSSTLEEKSSRIAEHEKEIAGYQGNIAQHKTQLEHLLRDLEKVKAEAADAVADMISSTHEKEIADTLAGISADSTNEELQRLRTLRQEVKAEVKISKELAGTDTKQQEAEFLEYAASGAVNDEFDALIGLAGAKDAGSAARPEKDSKTKLPE